jgi:ribosomal protein S12 methylthiotransferase accessory factor
MRSRLSKLESPPWQGIESFSSTDDFKPLSPFYRAFSFSQTIKKVLQQRLTLGITRVNYLTPLNRLDIPVFSITRPNVHSAQITATQGKGFFIREALASGLMECVERDAANRYSKFIRASEKELKNMGKTYSSLEEIGYQSKQDTLIDWVHALNLHTGQATLVPACEVIFPYDFPPGAEKINHSSTTGLSAGNTHLEAIIYGIFEVVERHAVSQFLSEKPYKVLDSSSIQSPEIRSLLDHLETIGAQWCIFDLSALVPHPCFFVSMLYLDAHTPPVMVAGQGCHISPIVALKRALFEAIQSHTVAIQGNREDLIRHQGEWEDDEADVITSWQKAKQDAEAQGFSQLPDFTHTFNTMFDLGTFACELLYNKGYKNILVTDLTVPNVRIPVVHVLISGMVDQTTNEHQQLPGNDNREAS